MQDIWERLYQAAARVRHGREVSPFVYAGQVSAAVETARGNVYVGVCVEGACGLAVCAERNAIYNMLTNGEQKIRRVLAITPDGTVGAPCGACRELMMQLDRDAGDIEILLDYPARRVCTLRALMPDWWGHARFEP